MIKFLTLFIKNYFHFGVSRSSAGLAYYLMFSVFPFIIFLNSILGMIDNLSFNIYEYLDFFPEQLQQIVVEYLSYLSSSANLFPFFVGLFLTLYSFTKYVNNLYHIINNIYGFSKPKLPLIKSFFFTISFMFSIYLMLILSVIGGQILNIASMYIKLPSATESLLNSFRYLIPAIYFFFVLILLYRFIPSKKVSFKSVFLGAFCAVIAQFVVSACFSIYITNFSNYSIIYGFLSAVMFLMMWLYFSSMVIVQGCVLNKMIDDFYIEDDIN